MKCKECGIDCDDEALRLDSDWYWKCKECVVEPVKRRTCKECGIDCDDEALRLDSDWFWKCKECVVEPAKTRTLP